MSMMTIKAPAEATLTDRPRWHRRPGASGAAFVLISMLFGLVFAFITPSFWGHDEISHFGRAYQVDHGHFLPERIADPRGVAYGGQVPATVHALTEHAINNYHNVPPDPQRRVDDPATYTRLEAQPLSSPLVTQWFTNTAAYSPIPYLPSVIGLRVAEIAGGSVGLAVDLMRIANLLCYTAIIWLALWSLRTTRFGWVVFTVGLLPNTVFQAGNITADTVTNALAILFTSLFVKATFLRTPLRRWETIALVASAVLLPVTKPTYVILCMLLLFVPPVRLAAGRFGRMFVVSATALSVATFGAWTAVSAKTSDGMGLMRPAEEWYSVIPAQQVHFVLTDFPHFLRSVFRTFVYRDLWYFEQFFGQFGFSGIVVPGVAIVCAGLALLLAGGISERLHAAGIELWAAAVLLVVSVLAIFGTLYLEYSPVGYYVIDGVQGRYFVPLAVVTAAVLLQLIPLRLHLPSARTLRGCVIAIPVLMSAALATSAAKYYFEIWI